jgi:CRISPR-associated exonuclease Cas4
MKGELLAVAVFLGILGVLLVVLALRGRRVRGLGSGETVALDNVTVFSERLKLVGRPDRIVRKDGQLIPEEWKSSKRVNEGHRLQLGTYFLLIEEQYGEQPPFGVVVLGDGSRVEVKNTEELRSKVLGVAERIRESRRAIREEIPVRQPAAKCRVCGQRKACNQARPRVRTSMVARIFRTSE